MSKVARFHQDPFAVEGEPCVNAECAVATHHEVEVIGTRGRTEYVCPELELETITPEQGDPFVRGNGHGMNVTYFDELTPVDHPLPICGKCGAEMVHAGGDPSPFVSGG
jgi:hypothetical protein